MQQMAIQTIKEELAAIAAENETGLQAFIREHREDTRASVLKLVDSAAK